MYPFTEPCSFAKSKIVLAFSTVARIFFSFRTIPESSINARMSRSDSRATFSGEKSRNAFRKWGHFFSIIRQFKPALKIALDIRSRYPWSSFGGTDFHPGIKTATLFALFMPTFAAVLASFEWVIRNAAVRRLAGTMATLPFTEKWTGWDQVHDESNPISPKPYVNDYAQSIVLMQLEKDQTVAIRRIKCPLACSGVFHPIATDKNRKPYTTCTDWGLTLWFNRGREGRIWWESYMPSETACPGCGRKVDPSAENPPDCHN